MDGVRMVPPLVVIAQIESRLLLSALLLLLCIRASVHMQRVAASASSFVASSFAARMCAIALACCQNPLRELNIETPNALLDVAFSVRRMP